MFKLALLCVVLFADRISAVLELKYEYIPDANTWLRLHISPATWNDARMQCKYEGGMLASPSTMALTNAMRSIMDKYRPSDNRVFIGIHDLISEGDFMSLDGIPVSEMLLDWKNYGLDNDEDKSCGLFTTHTSGEISVESCTSKHRFICRKENATMVENLNCRTTALGYEFEPRTRSCYKFHRAAQTWHRASKICHAEGGHLVIINSQTEADVIQGIFNNNPANTLIGAVHDFLALIGVWKWNDENGDWQTVHGQTLEEAGFAVWSDGQPNNLDGQQTVLAIQRGNKLNDISPYVKEAFICEISQTPPLLSTEDAQW